MKKLKLLFVGMLVLGFAGAAFSQCAPGIGIDITAEYQGTDTQAGFGLDETHPAGPTVVDYKVTVSLTASQCRVERGEVWLNFPDGSTIKLADKTLALNPGGSQVFDVTTDPYTIDSSDLGSLTGADADEVRATADVNVISIRDAPLTPQDAQASANYDIEVIFPEIEIVKSADPCNICEGEPATPVTYTYLVSWGASGDTILGDVNVTDDECSPVQRQPDQVGNDDDWLESGEVWVYECDALLTGAVTNTATATANDIFIGITVTDEDTAEVIASNPVCEDFTGDTEPDCCEVDLTLCISASGGVEPYTYEWTSSDSNWPITSGEDTNCITYDSGPSGSSTIFSVLITDALDCNVVCDLEVDCTPEPGDTFCTFTQGFWGNANGRFDGWTTEEWLDEYFGDVGSLTIGGATNSLTLSDTDCLLARMPAGGTPRCLEGLGDRDDNCASTTPSWLKPWLKKGNKKGARYNNVLMGQVIALTLNMWVDPNLGSLAFDDMPDIGDGIFCTQGEDPNDIQCFEMPDLGVDTVADLLALANDYLNCDGGDVSDIYTAVTSINEGFDECRTLVACVEICDDDRDNDCDGDVDCEDDECSTFPDCVD